MLNYIKNNSHYIAFTFIIFIFAASNNYSPRESSVNRSFMAFYYDTYFKNLNRDYRVLVISNGVRRLVGIRGLVEAIGLSRAIKLYQSAKACLFDVFTAVFRGVVVKFYNK